MIRPIFLTVSLSLAAQGVWAKSYPETKMKANLLKRCESGVATACFDYAKVAEKKQRLIYFRRACLLGHSAACSPVSTVAQTKIKEPGPKHDSTATPATPNL